MLEKSSRINSTVTRGSNINSSLVNYARSYKWRSLWYSLEFTITPIEQDDRSFVQMFSESNAFDFELRSPEFSFVSNIWCRYCEVARAPGHRTLLIVLAHKYLSALELIPPCISPYTDAHPKTVIENIIFLSPRRRGIFIWNEYRDGTSRGWN